METITLFGLLKIVTPVILLGLSLFSGLFIFIDDNIIIKLSLLEYKNSNIVSLSILFIFSISMLFAHIIFFLIKQIKYLIKNRNKEKINEKRLEALRKSLLQLTKAEKEYLRPYIIEGKNTINFSIDDGISGGLSEKKILYISSQVGSLVKGISYNMQPWAREYLSEHIELLK